MLLEDISRYSCPSDGPDLNDMILSTTPINCNQSIRMGITVCANVCIIITLIVYSDSVTSIGNVFVFESKNKTKEKTVDADH